MIQIPKRKMCPCIATGSDSASPAVGGYPGPWAITKYHQQTVEGRDLTPPEGGGAGNKVEGSETSSVTHRGGLQGGVRRRLTYGGGSAAEGALQAVGALLHHPPIAPEPETPIQCWLEDVANLVTTAQQQLITGGRASTAGTSHAKRGLDASRAPRRCKGRGLRKDQNQVILDPLSLHPRPG
uniref:Uncharacterized protein n=1 Tax=Oryza punctata TaxID=4537 RepID=A0A0E0JIH5_ORYPU